MTALLAFAVLSIAFSFLCSIWEAVLLSVTPSYIHAKVGEGGATGQLLQKFKQDVNAPLTAILSLNTIAHTVGAIGVGASTGAAFGEGGFDVLGFAISYEVIVSVVMTLAILILSEIIPKNIGASYWRSLAPFTVKSLNVLIKIFRWTGFIWLSKKIKELILGKTSKGDTALSRTDFLANAKASTKKGKLKVEEGRILENLFNLDELTVHDVMTPRTVVVGARASMTIQQFYDKFADSPFSRYPVFGETRDQVEGYVLKDMVFRAMIEGRHDESIRSLVRDLLPVPQTTNLHKTIDLLQERREPIAMVVDEFGGLEGLVTMEDAMETLLGLEIMDEMDTSQDMQELARNRWRKRATAMGLDLSTLEGTAIDEQVAAEVQEAVDKAVRTAQQNDGSAS